MRTRQSTANITHHDATHTFFIYMTTKTALNVQRQKQNIVTHWKYSLSWLPAFISCSSPLLDIVLEFSVSSSNFFLKYLYTKFNKSIVAFFFIPFASLCYSLKWSEKCTRVLIKSVPLLRVNLLILIVYIRMLI